MKAEETEQLRLSLLRFLDAHASVAADKGLPVGLLLQMSRAEGRPELTKAELNGELAYLADKGLIITTGKFISPEMKHWRITADGRDSYAQLTT